MNLRGTVSVEFFETYKPFMTQSRVLNSFKGDPLILGRKFYKNTKNQPYIPKVFQFSFIKPQCFVLCN